jgi:hypothetical protein
MMFPPAMELLLASQLALVLMQALLPTVMFPLPPAELPHKTMSAPFVCKVLLAPTAIVDVDFRRIFPFAPEVMRFESTVRAVVLEVEWLSRVKFPPAVNAAEVVMSRQLIARSPEASMAPEGLVNAPVAQVAVKLELAV